MTAATVTRAVAIGGGTGLPVVLGCLLDLGLETTAIVTMADDGGSSGALRRELGMLPPGDVRNCLVAMAEEPDGLLARMLQYRFEQGEGLAGHSLGNLVIAALADLAGGFPEAIETLATSLHARGRVIPSTIADVRLHGIDRAGNEVIGQACLAANPAPVEHAFLEPLDAPAYQPAVEAIGDADVVVLGPGSLYTSVIPNLLVEGVARALRDSSARCIYICNVANMRGETLGLDAADHVQALLEHGLEGRLDLAVVHDCRERGCPKGIEAVGVDADVVARIEALGVGVMLADLADPSDLVRHDAIALKAALREVLA